MTPDDIIEAVCAVTKIGRDDILGTSRLRKHSWPRHLAIFLIVKHCKQHNRETAKIFNRHTNSISRYVNECFALFEHVPLVCRWRDDTLARLTRRAA